MHTARREYVLSAECPPTRMWKRACWQCRNIAEVHELFGVPTCSKCGAPRPMEHRERLLELADRADLAELAELEISYGSNSRQAAC